MLTTAEMNAGRKLSARADEPWVEGSDQLVRVDYTYWTLAYILSATGEPSVGRCLGSITKRFHYLTACLL
jgi:hypothetical protein